MSRPPVAFRLKPHDAALERLLDGGVQQVRVVLRALALLQLDRGASAPAVAESVRLFAPAIRNMAQHYTPKHGSWRNQAEIELSVVARQCLGQRRMALRTQLQAETRAWNTRANRRHITIVWRFTRKDSRRKFGYQSTLFNRLLKTSPKFSMARRTDCCKLSRLLARRCAMRGSDLPQTALFSYLLVEDRMPRDHPLRATQALVNPILTTLSPRFQALYSAMGRPSIPPERLLRAMLLRKLYTIHEERERRRRWQQARVRHDGHEASRRFRSVCLLRKYESAARPAGSMEVLKVVWWKHNSKAGQYSSAKVHRTLTVGVDGKIALEDLAGLSPEIIEGF